MVRDAQIHPYWIAGDTPAGSMDYASKAFRGKTNVPQGTPAAKPFSARSQRHLDLFQSGRIVKRGQVTRIATFSDGLNGTAQHLP